MSAGPVEDALSLQASSDSVLLSLFLASSPSKFPSIVGSGENGTAVGTAWPLPETLFRRAALLPDRHMSAASRAAVGAAVGAA